MNDGPLTFHFDWTTLAPFLAALLAAPTCRSGEAREPAAGHMGRSNDAART